VRIRLLIIAAGLAGTAGAAPAQKRVAAAEHRFDVDGDGKVDVIRIDDPPALSVVITGNPGKSGFRPFTVSGRVTGGTITASRSGGSTWIVATAEIDHQRREAMAVRWSARGGIEPLWTGAVGEQEPDHDWSLEVAATEHGLLRWQGRPGVTRCDGKPAWLFLEGWDAAAGRFRRIQDPLPRVDPAAPTLRAERGAPITGGDAVPALLFRRALVSAQAGAGRADELLPARELTDADPATAWREGRGEVIVLRSGAPAAVRAVRIIPGDASSPAAFAAANRLRRAALLVGDRAYWIELPRDPAGEPAAMTRPYWVVLDPPVESDCVSLIVDQVWSGRSGDTAIAELSVLTDLELRPGGGATELATAVAAGGADGERAGRALVALGAAR